MRPRAFRALLRLELRRALAIVPRLLISLAVFTGACALLGWLNAERLGLLIGVACAVLVLQAPATVIRDKLDGSLEFLVTLPVSPETHVASRFAYVLLAGVPAGIGLAYAMSGGAPLSTAPLPGGTAGFVLSTVWFTVLASALSIGCTLRFRTIHVANGFGGLLFAGIALDELLPKLFPDLSTFVRSVLEKPWMPLAATATTIVGSALLTWLAFHLARTGIERFAPGRDRITW